VESLRLASMVDATSAEGPGLRFALWTQGCPLACPGCCNPHLWTERGGGSFSVDAVWERVAASRERHRELEGLSLIGGEPFEQDEPLAALSTRARASGLTVMAYTGYTIEELRARGSALLQAVDLLVDGRYVEALRTTKRRFIGSTNQRLFFLSDAYREDDPRFREPNHAELRLDHQGELTVVGFPFERVMSEFGPGSRLHKERRVP